MNDLVNGSAVSASARLARRFKALACLERPATSDVLRAEKACVCHVEAVLGRRQTYILPKLRLLRSVGLIQDRRYSLKSNGCACPACDAVAAQRKTKLIATGSD